MVKLEFYLNYSDIDRLFSIKAKQHKHNLTGNEFAKELFVAELYRLCPVVDSEEWEDDFI